jgi:methionyl-tRNA formyltransferase
METLSAGLSEPAPQEGDVTYAEKIESEDLHLDWSRPADELMRVIRLERAWTMFRGDRLRVLEAAPGDDEGDRLSPGRLAGAVVGTAGVPLRLLRVQPAGRAAMSGADWARGARLIEADVLGDTSDER